jgi:hypothetical protein
MNAFCRVAPSLRLRPLAIFLAGVLLRAADFNSRTSVLVQARLFVFRLAMYGSPNLKRALVAGSASKRKSNNRLVEKSTGAEYDSISGSKWLTIEWLRCRVLPPYQKKVAKIAMPRGSGERRGGR